MNILYVRHKFGVPSPLPPEETLRYTRDDLKAVTHYSAPLCRGFYERFLCSVLLRVTDRRMTVSTRVSPPLFFRWQQEIDCWFPGRQPEGEVDTITDLSLGIGNYGPCLIVHSQNPSRRNSWFSSPDLTVWLYCTEPEAIERAVREAMAENPGV